MFLSREIDIKLCQNYTSDKAIKDIVANRASPSLHSGSFEITLTVPLNTIPGIRWKSWNLKGGRKGIGEENKVIILISTVLIKKFLVVRCLHNTDISTDRKLCRVKNKFRTFILEHPFFFFRYRAVERSEENNMLILHLVGFYPF